MPEIICAIEPLFPDLVKEIQPLWREQYEEISGCDPDVIVLDPDYVRLREMEKIGAFVPITCRVDGELIGYFFWLITPHLHYRKSLTAQDDVYYIQPLHRNLGAGRKMFEFAMQVCRDRKVKRVLLSCKVSHDHGQLIEAFGFKHFENLYELIL